MNLSSMKIAGNNTLYLLTLLGGGEGSALDYEFGSDSKTNQKCKCMV